MAIITISGGSFSHGKEIAEKVAETLGYECVSREILQEASQFFHVSEKKLLKSLHDAPTFLEKVTHRRERYIAYIRAALLEHVKKDNVIYHGHAGHLFIPEIAHVLKVRIVADMDERVALLQQRQKTSRDEAIVHIRNGDRHRADWTRFFYKVDIEDPLLYDIIINIGGIRIDDACKIICSAARCETYKTTLESKKAINDLALQSHVSASLQTVCDAKVTSQDGYVHVKVTTEKITKTGYSSPQMRSHIQETIRDDLTKEIIEIIRRISDVKDVVCDVELPYYS